MIDSFIEIIILILLVWIFEHKILPQIIIMFLTIYMAITELAAGTEWRWVILFAAVVMYSGFQIFSQEKEED